MKFNFKIQPFQTEAVESVVRVFEGQPKQEPVSYGTVVK
jgi:type III restriction enzyme